MMQSEEIAELAKALCKAQALFTVVPKKGKGAVRGGKQDAYALYSDIMDMVRKPLADNGLALLYQPDHENVLFAKLLHTSGQWISCSLQITGGTPQALGSSITYMKRYSTTCILGLASEDHLDDDGQVAEADAKKSQRARKPTSEKPAAAAQKPSSQFPWALGYKAAKIAENLEKEPAESWMRLYVQKEYGVESTKQLSMNQVISVAAYFQKIIDSNTPPEEK